MSCRSGLVAEVCTYYYLEHEEDKADSKLECYQTVLNDFSYAVLRLANCPLSLKPRSGGHMQLWSCFKRNAGYDIAALTPPALSAKLRSSLKVYRKVQPHKLLS